MLDLSKSLFIVIDLQNELWNMIPKTIRHNAISDASPSLSPIRHHVYIRNFELIRFIRNFNSDF